MSSSILGNRLCLLLCLSRRLVTSKGGYGILLVSKLIFITLGLGDYECRLRLIMPYRGWPVWSAVYVVVLILMYVRRLKFVTLKFSVRFFVLVYILMDAQGSNLGLPY